MDLKDQRVPSQAQQALLVSYVDAARVAEPAYEEWVNCDLKMLAKVGMCTVSADDGVLDMTR